MGDFPLPRLITGGWSILNTRQVVADQYGFILLPSKYIKTAKHNLQWFVSNYHHFDYFVFDG